MAATIPVILSGGSGTRLWPLSRRSNPKQLQRLIGSSSLLEATVARVADLSRHLMVVASAGTLDLIEPQLPPHARVIAEPVGRNTAPAVAVAAMLSSAEDVLLMLPADHHIDDVASFRIAVDKAVEAASDGKLVAFGILPTRVETGFGYIVPSGIGREVQTIKRFVEKPEPSVARTLIDEGALWNSGMFALPAGLVLEELRVFVPEVVQAVEGALRTSRIHGTRVELGTGFVDSPSVSIDVAVMERTDRAVVVPLEAGWSDVGSWESLWEIGDKDSSDNAVTGDVVTMDSRQNYLRSEGPLVATIGVEGLVVIATQDAVLVAPRDRVQEVKRLVEMLESRPDLT
ncbi:MAG: mannose-1-phosphate guanylyltransferase [Acidimicrobiia bacterium]